MREENESSATENALYEKDRFMEAGLLYFVRAHPAAGAHPFLFLKCLFVPRRIIERTNYI